MRLLLLVLHIQRRPHWPTREGVLLLLLSNEQINSIRRMLPMVASSGSEGVISLNEVASPATTTQYSLPQHWNSGRGRPHRVNQLFSLAATPAVAPSEKPYMHTYTHTHTHTQTHTTHAFEVDPAGS